MSTNKVENSDERVSLANIIKTYGKKKGLIKNSPVVQQTPIIIQKVEDTKKDEISNLQNGNSISNKTSLEKQLVADGKVLGCLFCGVCEFQTNIPTFMTAHMRKHKRKKNVICEKCFRRFKKGIELVKHNRIAHRKIQYKCSVCNFITNKQDVLKEHCMTHKEINLADINIEKTIIVVPSTNCNICGYEFIDKLLLKQHKKLHEGNQAFVCKVCRNQFKTADDMKRIENTETGLYQYLCKCKCKYTLIDPIKGKLKLSEGQRPFHCGICPCKFKNPYVLTTHVKSHLERTAYKCNHCSNTYRMLAHLESHMRSHRNNPS